MIVTTAMVPPNAAQQATSQGVKVNKTSKAVAQTNISPQQVEESKVPANFVKLLGIMRPETDRRQSIAKANGCYMLFNLCTQKKLHKGNGFAVEVFKCWTGVTDAFAEWRNHSKSDFYLYRTSLNPLDADFRLSMPLDKAAKTKFGR